MRNLLRLLSKYNHVLLFLVLELVAFGLIFRNINYHQTSFVSASSGLTGTLYSWRTEFTDYLDLKESNLQLAAENARLRNRLKSSYVVRTPNNTTFVNDSVFLQKYSYSEARVLNNSTHMINNNITIDKGALDGIEVDQGVIGPEGIVGFVTDVSDHFAVLSSVLNKAKFNAGVRTKNTNYPGHILWLGGDARIVSMEDIPSHAELELGDTIVTSAASGLFPENVPVGTIVKINTEPGSDYKQADVQPFTDFAKIHHVYVIQNLLKTEQIKLEAQAAQ